MKKIKQWWKNLTKKRKIIWVSSLIVFFVVWFLLIMWWSVWSWTTTWCGIGAFSIQGDIYSHLSEEEYQGNYVSAEDIIGNLISVEDFYDAILLDITSWGGSPAASKEIADYVAKMNIPVIVSVREAATSGGYWIASQADKIFAAPLSDIGSIGVTMSYLDYSNKNQRDGLVWQSISSGEFKDTGNENKSLNTKEREILMRDVDLIHKQFVADVAKARNMSLEDVEKIADGSSVLAEQALELGLIDGVMHQWEVENYIKKTYPGIEGGICWENYNY